MAAFVADVRPPDDNARRNFRLNVMDGVTWGGSMAFISQSAILPLFISHYTDTKWVLGLTPAIAALAGNTFQLLGSAYTARQQNFWLTLRLQIILPRASIALLCIAPWLPAPWALAWFFVAYTLFNLAAAFNAPAWFEFVSHVIPAEQRGLFFGYRATFGGVMSLAAAGIASWSLAALPAPANFGLCFLFALALNVWSMSCIFRTRHDFSAEHARRAAAPLRPPSLFALLAARPRLRGYMAARCVLSLTTGATAFYIVSGKASFHLTESASSLLAIALAYLPALVGLPLGRLADRYGTKRVQVPCALLAGLGSLALAASTTLPVYTLGLLFIGNATAAFSISDSKWLLDDSPEDAGTVLSVFSFALAPLSMLASLGAGAVVQNMGAPLLFSLSALAWAIGAFGLARVPAAR